MASKNGSNVATRPLQTEMTILRILILGLLVVGSIQGLVCLVLHTELPTVTHGDHGEANHFLLMGKGAAATAEEELNSPATTATLAVAVAAPLGSRALAEGGGSRHPRPAEMSSSGIDNGTGSSPRLGTGALVAAEARREVSALSARLGRVLGELKATRKAAASALRALEGAGDPPGCAPSNELAWWSASASEPRAGSGSLRVLNWNLWNLQEQWPARRDAMAKVRCRACFLPLFTNRSTARSLPHRALPTSGRLCWQSPSHRVRLRCQHSSGGAAGGLRCCAISGPTWWACRRCGCFPAAVTSSRSLRARAATRTSSTSRRGSRAGMRRKGSGS